VWVLTNTVRPFDRLVSKTHHGTYDAPLPVIKDMIKYITLLSSLASLPLLGTHPALAQFGGPKVAAVTSAVKHAAVARGGEGVLSVTINVGPQYHINAHQPNDPAYIPTSFVGQPSPGITYGAVHYPAPRTVRLSYSTKPLLVYIGKVVISIPYKVSRSAKPGATALVGTVMYQGCNDKSCFPPASAPVRAVVTVK
jgi:DsbC/DsbD-like thiol-disulfide interchange protein